MRIRGSLIVLVLLGLGKLAAVCPAHADGPWKAQIVDAETGTPLEGVVVLAYWVKWTASWGGWAGGDFVDAEETVTGPDGRFVIPPHSTFTLMPWRKITGQLMILKSEYGQWAFRGGNPLLESIWTRLEREVEIIELPRLRTWEERLKFYSRGFSIPPPVPAQRVPRLRQAIDTERVYLGLGKMYERTP
jgi:hypothetical protein